jgi:hypothetical protein
MYIKGVMGDNALKQGSSMVEEDEREAQVEGPQPQEAEAGDGGESLPTPVVNQGAPVEGQAPLEEPHEVQIGEPDADQPHEISDDELEERLANEAGFSWQASEFVHHQKGVSWYAGLFAVMLVLVGLAILLHMWLEIVLFAVMAVAVMIYAGKPPRTMQYELSPSGLRIDDKEYQYREFRSFGVLPEEEWHTIDLEPAKRFAPPLSIIFDDRDFHDIVSHLEIHLPRVDRKPDAVERLTRYVRF